MADRYSWKRRKPKGRYKAEKTYELRLGGQELATAQSCAGGWFWYGDGVNTANRPDTFENVKADAVAYFKSKTSSSHLSHEGTRND